MEQLIRRRIIRARIPRKVFKDRENPFDCDDAVFFQRYRFTKDASHFIIDELTPQLQRATKRGKAFPPHLIVLISLHILGSGTFQFSSGQLNMHSIGQSGISKMFKEFRRVLISKIKHFIKFPKEEHDIRRTKTDFYSKFGFPNVIGAIDGTHVAIQKPAVWDAYAFFNRKAYYSINVQAVCNASYYFSDVVVRWPGSTHDSHIYKSSSVYSFLHSNEFPRNTWLLGDNGYPIEHCLMTPIINPSTDNEKKYNEKHKSTRKIVEMSFGLLKSRFRIISKSGGMLCYTVKNCVDIITCCFILHNIALEKNVPRCDDEENDNGDTNEIITETEETPTSTTSCRVGNRIREILVSTAFP